MQTRNILSLGVAIVALGVYSQPAHARDGYSCSTATYSSSYGACDTSDTSNQNSTTVTSTAVLSTAATQTASIISSRVANAIAGAGTMRVASNGFSASTGRAAGDSSTGAAVWASGAWTRAEDNNASTEADGHVWSGMVGVDYKLSEESLIGLGVGYEDLDFDTAYNGFGSLDGSLKGKGWTVAPYAAYDLGGVVANLSVGYTSVDYDTVRYEQGTGYEITGSPEADRYFVTAGLGASQQLADHVRLRSNASVFYVREDKDSYTETVLGTSTTVQNGDDTSELGKAALDFRLGYAFEGVEPYALVGADYDFVKSDVPLAAGQTESGTQDDFGAKFGAGVSINLGSNVTGGIEAYTSEFREDYNEYNASAVLRAKF